MSPINHAATALLLTRRWPALPLLPALLAVQAMEILWVVCNFLGLEYLHTADKVESLADISLIHQPWSHSLPAAFLLSALAWGGARGLGKSSWAWPLALGVFSHFVLDLLTHAPDLALLPGILPYNLGSGLYQVPTLALLLETVYGLVIWRMCRGSKALLLSIVGVNLAGLSIYVPAIPGPESLLAGRPWMFVLLIASNMLVSGWLLLRYAPVVAKQA